VRLSPSNAASPMLTNSIPARRGYKPRRRSPQKPRQSRPGIHAPSWKPFLVDSFPAPISLIYFSRQSPSPAPRHRSMTATGKASAPCFDKSARDFSHNLAGYESNSKKPRPPQAPISPAKGKFEASHSPLVWCAVTLPVRSADRILFCQIGKTPNAAAIKNLPAFCNFFNKCGGGFVPWNRRKANSSVHPARIARAQTPRPCRAPTRVDP